MARPIDADALHTEISKWPESVMYKDWVQSAIATEPTITPPDESLTLERVAKEYLEICDNFCSGDSSVGIGRCPFFLDDEGCELWNYLREEAKRKT